MSKCKARQHSHAGDPPDCEWPWCGCDDNALRVAETLQESGWISPDESETLRRLLWLRHGCDGLYGDDGEMQCGQCLIDFRRNTVQEIERRFSIIGARALAMAEAAKESK